MFKTVMKQYPVIAVLIALNVIMFIICEIAGGSTDNDVLLNWGAMYVPYVADGQWWRLFTAMFLHAGLRHLVNNMILLGALGAACENSMAHWKVAVIYLLGGLAGNVASYFYYISSNPNVISMGASGCVYAVMGALIYMVIRNKGRLAGYSMRQMLILLAFSVYFSIVGANVAAVAHFGGLIGGFILCVILYHGREKGL